MVFINTLIYEVIRVLGGGVTVNTKNGCFSCKKKGEAAGVIMVEQRSGPASTPPSHLRPRKKCVNCHTSQYPSYNLL